MLDEKSWQLPLSYVGTLCQNDFWRKFSGISPYHVVSSSFFPLLIRTGRTGILLSPFPLDCQQSYASHSLVKHNASPSAYILQSPLLLYGNLKMPTICGTNNNNTKLSSQRKSHKSIYSLGVFGSCLGNCYV